MLYAVVQRAIDRGLLPLLGARQLDAGAESAATARGAAGDAAWERLAGPEATLSTDVGLQPGVYSASWRLVAVNRPAAEDAGVIISDERIDGLFRGLSYARISGQAGAGESVVQEIWRAFLIAMLGALVLEGILSLPRPALPAASGRAPLGAAA